MVRALLLAGLAVGLVAVPGGVPVRAAGDEKKEPAAPPTAEKIVSVLQNSRVQYDKDLQTTPFPELLGDLAKRYDLTFVVDKVALGDAVGGLNDAKADRLSTARLDGLPLGTFLDIYFRGLSIENVTYLVRPDYIEITTREAAQKEAGLPEAIQEATTTGEPGEVVRAKARMNLPLVCVAVKDKPLGAVLKDLTRVYGLNIVVEPGARQALAAELTEQLLNVPADTALEVLAGQAGLSVVRKGNVFRITAGGGAM